MGNIYWNIYFFTCYILLLYKTNVIAGKQKRDRTHYSTKEKRAKSPYKE